MIIDLLTTDSYNYDDANRLTDVNGVTYTFDANGNLLSDGVNAYTYDSANRLKSISNQSSVTSYASNGLNDRLQETMNGSTTNFTMDLNSGLTQALSDGTNTYVYGVDRIAQVNTGTQYFLGDALGSVRQLTNQSGAITYARVYDPYGVVTQTSGAAQTAYGYTGEFTSNDMVYLRARFYAPSVGRFLARDTWGGDVNQPMSYNSWLYTYGNPVNYVDKTGLSTGDPVSPLRLNGIYLSGDWTHDREKAVTDAIVAVGIAINRTVGQSRDPFKSVGTAYQTTTKPILFLWGNSCDDPNFPGLFTGPSIKGGGITLGPISYKIDGQTKQVILIKFMGMSGQNIPDPIKMRNNVVHELGHAFAIAMQMRGWTNPNSKLDTDKNKIKDLVRGTDPNGYYGFASNSHDMLWQQHGCNLDAPKPKQPANPHPWDCEVGAEIFADQFLGWTFNTWETVGGDLSPQGKARSDWMNENMFKWLRPIFPHTPVNLPR